MSTEPNRPTAIRLPQALGVAAALAAVVCVGAPAAAQSVVLPKEGMQYFTVGLVLTPGFLYDQTAHSRGLSTTAPAVGGAAEAGITQIVTRAFYISAEGQLGVQWIDENTADQDANAPSSSSLAWQVGLHMQWLPVGERLGWTAGAGLDLYQVHLDEAPLQILGAQVRVGKYIWTDQENFLLVQVGYHAPIIEGLNRPNDFDATAEWADRHWTFHRFSLGFQYGF